MTMARKPKTNKDQTLDNFHVSGTDKLDLAEVIGRQTDNTRVYHKRGSELTWYCITTNGVEDVMKACPADPMKSGSGRFMKLSALKQKGSPVAHWPAELYEEATVINRIFIGLTDDTGEFRIFPVTARIGSDFAGIGITGSAAQRASYHLLGLVAEQTEDRYVTLVTRVQPDKAGDIEKVITMRSDGYAYIPQDEALALASDVCADGDIVYWDVTNFFTEAVYQFPKSAVNTTFGRKKGEFMPTSAIPPPTPAIAPARLSWAGKSTDVPFSWQAVQIAYSEPTAASGTSLCVIPCTQMQSSSRISLLSWLTV